MKAVPTWLRQLLDAHVPAEPRQRPMNYISARVNGDLRDRRRALGLRQHDLLRLLDIGDLGSISRFEVYGDPLPFGKGRKDYERVLAEAERQQKRGAK